MILVTCIQKFKNKNGKIYGYRLRDFNGQIQDVTPDNLKRAIKQKKINVVNLSLTADDRLIDKHVESLGTLNLGKTPKAPKDITLDKTNASSNNNVAKALVILDKQLLGLGQYSDGFSTIVGSLFKKSKNNTTDSELNKILYNQYLDLVNNHPDQIDALIYKWAFDSAFDAFLLSMLKEKVREAKQSKIYQALTVVYRYAQKHNLEYADLLKDRIETFKERGIPAKYFGWSMSHSYFRYLDNDIFGDTKETEPLSPDLCQGYDYAFYTNLGRVYSKLGLGTFLKTTSYGAVQGDTILLKLSDPIVRIAIIRESSMLINTDLVLNTNDINLPELDQYERKLAAWYDDIADDIRTKYIKGTPQSIKDMLNQS